MEETQQKLKLLLDKIFVNRQDAYQWLLMARHFTHAVDDIHDIEDRRKDDEYIGLVFNKALDVYSHNFYATHRDRLYSIFKHIHNTYYDSLKWEKSEIQWQKTYADVIRCCANDLLCTVVEIVTLEETGSYDLAYEAKREVSIVAKEYSWLCHHNDKGEAI